MLRRCFAILLLIVLCTPAASAAPLWLERRFVPAPSLIDPVFAEAAAVGAPALDYGAFQAFLDRRRTDGPAAARVDYAAIDEQDLESLRAFISDLTALDPVTLNRADQTAYWINLYNAETIRRVADAWPTTSIRKIKGVWSDKTLTVRGAPLSLGDIEHHILRAAFPDPRIHYALNCASLGCPDLAAHPYNGADLDAQLASAARAFVNDVRGVRFDGDKLIVSKIFGWYREDFGGDDVSIIRRLMDHAEPALAARLSDRISIDGYDYDWVVNSTP